jgi:hypothetical protein
MRETVEWHRWNGELVRVRVETSVGGWPAESRWIVGAWLFDAYVSAHPRDQIGYWNATFPQAFNLYNNPYPDPVGLAALRAEIVPVEDADAAEIAALERDLAAAERIDDAEWPPSDGPLELEGSFMWPLPRRER